MDANTTENQVLESMSLAHDYPADFIWQYQVIKAYEIDKMLFAAARKGDFEKMIKLPNK